MTDETMTTQIQNTKTSPGRAVAIATAIGLVAITAGIVGYTVGRSTPAHEAISDITSDTMPGATSSEMGTTNESALGQREISYWRAPMDPTEIYDQPGKSRMGMDLVPVYADELESARPTPGGDATAGNMVVIESAVSQNMGVRSEPVRVTDFTRTIRTVGKVDYDEEALRVASTRISGWIEELFVDFVGEEVAVGQPLLSIYSPELVSTQQEFLLALRNYERAAGSSVASAKEDAARLLASTRQRLEYWDIPDELIKSLEETREVRRTVTLRAPATGIVIRKEAVEGAHVAAGVDLFEIADLSSVWVHASFYDDELPWIKEGQPVEMELSYLPGRTFRGRVSYVYPYLRDKARDAHARIVFQNPDLALKPGMYVNIHIEGSPVAAAVVVPLEAVIRSGARTIAFVDHGDGRYEPREISIGEEGGDNNAYVRVLAGLSAGDRVVTSAQFMLDSESRLQEAIQKLLGRRAERHNGMSMSGDGIAAPQTMADSVATHSLMAARPMADSTANHDAENHSPNQEMPDHAQHDH